MLRSKHARPWRSASFCSSRTSAGRSRGACGCRVSRATCSWGSPSAPRGPAPCRAKKGMRSGLLKKRRAGPPGPGAGGGGRPARPASGAIVSPPPAVSLVVLWVSPWSPLTRHQPLGDALVVALVLGTLAAASSPAVTMAMMSELDAHGPVARALLGITVVKDVAVALLFALVLALGKALTSAGALNVAVAGTAILQLLGSAASGSWACATASFGRGGIRV